MAETEAQIEYKTEAGAFKVVLTAASVSVFMQAAQQQDIIIKEGEELIAALLAYAKGSITSIERTKDGRLNDGINGEPAIQKFDSTLKTVYLRRYKDGRLNDGINGEPAIQDYSDGRPTVAMSYKDGTLLKTFSGEEKAKCQETIDKNKAKAFLDKLKIKNPGQ
jgi:hypothetical protein